MSIRPIDHQISALNTVTEAKNQQNQQNKGQNINAFMQDNMQNEVERNKSKVIQSDHAQGNKVDPDGREKGQREDGQKKKRNKHEKQKSAKEDFKGNRLDIRI